MNSTVSTTAASRPGSALSSYMSYVSDEGLDLERFVEHGGYLITPGQLMRVREGLPELREKIETLSAQHPDLAAQLEFLAHFLDANFTASRRYQVAPEVLKEVAFALMYAASDMDLVPDDIPCIGYSDDAAVAATVILRHSPVFERFSAIHSVTWFRSPPVLIPAS